MNDNFNENDELDELNQLDDKNISSDSDESSENLKSTDVDLEQEESEQEDLDNNPPQPEPTPETSTTDATANDTFCNSGEENTQNQSNTSQEYNPNNPYYPPNLDPNQPNYPPIPPNAYYNPYFNNPYMQNMQRPPYIPPMDPRLGRQNTPNMYQNQYNGFDNMEQFNNGDNSNLDEIDEYVYSNTNNILVPALILLLLCSLGFSFYLYNSYNNNSNSYYSSGDSPSMEMSYTPDPIPNDDINGVLTNNEIHTKVSPSVVGIAVYTRGLGNVLQSEGSGIVMSEDGFVITNYHVIANDSTNPVVKIEIIMHDGETYDARVIGGDSKTDLAVVKIDAVGLIPAEFGDSAKLKIGDRVAVIGNPSGIAFAGSFTQGCVSALSRSIYMSDLNAEIEYIQTDAAINSGNSGGAFINEYGQVVGISAAKMKVEAGYEGMGFAIPINNAKIVIDSLIEYGYVAGRPRVGIEYKAISPTLAELNSIPIGLRVYLVSEDVDAYNHILAGDIITMFDGMEVYDSETVSNALSDKRAGEKLVVTIYRVDEETGVSEYIDVTIILSESVGEKLAETMY